jgi:hypothetical protein
VSISDEAVEAAAAAMWEKRPMTRTSDGAPLPFGDAHRYQRIRFRDQARAALEAAAPNLLAGAWDEGYDARASEYPFGDVYYNPYRSAGAGE